MYIDHLDYEQARPMEDPEVAAQVSRGPKTARTTRNPGILNHHDRLISSNPSRVCD